MLTLEQALAELPDTADGIADKMRALGIKGTQEHGDSCPLANWLKSRGFAIPWFGSLWVTVWDGIEHRECDTPDGASEFVRRFDAGVYLDLVEVAHG